jgi:hypothetical protein
LRENKDANDAFTSELKYYPLPEDYDLRAFLPLQKRLSIYRYSKVTRQRPIKPDKILVLRAKRFLELGRTFSNMKMTDRQNILKLVENSELEDKIELFEAVEHVIPKAFNDGILIDLEKLCLNKEFSEGGKLESGLKENITIDKPGTKTLSMEEVISGNSTLKLSESIPSDEQNLQKPLSIKRAQRTNVAMAAILRQAAATSDTISSEPNKETSAILTKQVKFEAPSPAPSTSLQDSPYFQKLNTLQDEKIPNRNIIEGGSHTDFINENLGMLFGQDAMHKKDINPSVRHPIDFSVPPPSIPLRTNPTIPSRRDVTADMMNIHSDSHNISKMFPDSFLPSRNNQIHQQLLFSHDQQHQTAIIDNRPPLFGGSLPFPASSIWQNSQHPIANNNISSHSENPEQLYQLPQFGGLNKPDQTLPKQSPVLHPPPGADSRGLQFQQPYPSNEVRTEIKSTSSEADLNRSSPTYHRLFSMDPTWSVTPGSLTPSTSDNRNLLQSNFGNRSNVNLTHIPNTFNEMQRLDLSEQEHSVKNKHKTFHAEPST